MAELKSHLVDIVVTNKEGVPDPEKSDAASKIKRYGEGSTLHTKGQYFKLSVPSETVDEAIQTGMKACDLLLANPVLHKYEVVPSDPERGYLLVSNLNEEGVDHTFEALVIRKPTVTNPAAIVTVEALNNLLDVPVQMQAWGSYYLLSVPGETKAQALGVVNTMVDKGLRSVNLDRFDIYPTVPLT